MQAKFKKCKLQLQKQRAEEIKMLQSNRLKMQEEIDRMKKEMNKLKYTLEMVPQYDIDEFKDNDGDIAFNLASKTMTQ